MELKLKEPTKAIKSEYYLAVIKDANGTYHFWLPNGKYDGYDKVLKCKPIKLEKPNKALQKEIDKGIAL